MTPLQEVTTKMAKDAGFKPCLECGTPSPKGEQFCDWECERNYAMNLAALTKKGRTKE